MAEDSPKITIERNGPYVVEGRVPLVRKTPVVSEFGEPLTWEKGPLLRASKRYLLCRCGKSNNKPLCDGTHTDIGFDGTEAADQSLIADRQKTYDGVRITIKDDRSLCMHAGFCGTRVSNVWKMIEQTEDTQVRAQVMAMIERCPSGALSYALDPETDAPEPDLSVGIAVTPDGPLWVIGGIPVERADGMPIETRNRVTLCRCGASKTKPLCDGSHRDIGFTSE